MCSGTNVTVISDLMANSMYRMRVKAFVDGNHGSAEEKDVTTSTREPSASPENVTLLVRNKRQLSFSWSPPPCGSRGGIITGYVYKLSGRGPTILDDTAFKSVTIPQLIPFTNYSFQVAANTSAGTGPYSEVVTGKTLEAEPTVPLNVAIQNVDDVSITVKWSEPDPPQGIITQYNVRYRRDGETKNKTDTDVTPLVYSIMSLDTNVTYYVQVQAETSVGAGPWSQEVNATTKIGIPGPVQNLRVKNTTETTITLDWNPPQNPKGHISHYIVSSKVFSSSDQYEKDEETAPPFTKDKLNPATAYELAVSAHNEKFEGDSASLVVFTKPQTNPPEPPQPLFYGNETTETTVTIGLSKPADGAQFVESYVVRVKTVSGSSVSKRDILIPDRFEDSPADYLAAELPSRNAPNKFVVGDTKLYGVYYNAPLETGAEYEIRTGSVSQGNETEAYVTYSTPLRVTVKKPGMSPGMSPAVIAAIVVVIVIIIVGVVVALVVYKRRRASHGMHQSDMGSDFPLNEKSLAVDSEESQDSAVHHYTNDGAAVSDQPSQKQRRPLPKQRQNKSETKPAAEDKEAVEFVQPPPIRREDLAEYIRNKELSGDNGFLADYKSLPDGQLHPWTVASKPENKAKNRYVNVIAYDHSRVVLEPIEGDPHSDYVNACYINGYKSKGKYIASQGPNKASIKDIWRMVWQLGIDKIVMLTNPVENGKVKCLQYWADTGSTTISDIVVTTDKEDVFLDYTIRNFCIHEVGSEDGSRSVKQFHYTTWPDMKPPEYPAPVLNFLRLVNAHHNTGRTMVHCSAGVGRTGTFIALDVMLKQMQKEEQVDVFGFVYQMRQNRIKMVQTPDQYKFIFDALLAASVTGDTTYTTEGFRKKLAGLKKVQKGAKETGLQLQFANLTVLTASHGKKAVKSGEFPENKDKNRYPDFVPSDRSRPFLFTKAYDKDSDYINATFMPGYRKKNMYIGTQMPMPNTVSDFWRMVYDHKVPTIVMLNTFDANDKTMCRYWPEQGTIDFGPLLVELIGIKEYSGITERNFTLRNTKTKVLSEDVRRITQFQYHDWPSNEDVPRSVKGLLSLVELTQKQHDDKGPTAVHCMDGLGSTSVFCALMALVDQFKFEKAVDVFQAVHRLRMVNSNMMYSEGQFALCYDVVQTLLDSTSIYENVTPSNDSEI
ncbi:receptor-type tyrosine-protein phosphatase kappa-like isoform X2 [Acanthaster planci]|uniref:protein-tyrosine-phosphatase n=1 Tax=Acanthaster planci TaxID=133434 RepID=A0A8B7ZXD2_ACAPL|nr:receptor-type tyrosine-protein phosphatase kappa-like isoform X2 [Acanthaster planci]